MIWIKTKDNSYINADYLIEITVVRIAEDDVFDDFQWVIKGYCEGEDSFILRGPFNSEKDAKSGLEALMKEKHYKR